jgi:hypothetical protein
MSDSIFFSLSLLSLSHQKRDFVSFKVERVRIKFSKLAVCSDIGWEQLSFYEFLLSADATVFLEEPKKS